MAKVARAGGAKRSKAQREKDLLLVERDVLGKGMSYRDFAEQLNSKRPYSITYVAVAHDVKTVLKRLRERYNVDTANYMAKLLLRYDAIYQEAWKSWEASKVDLTKRKGVMAGTVSSSPQQQQQMVPSYGRDEVTTERRDGDPQYLRVMMDCNKEIAKLVGLHVQHNYYQQNNYHTSDTGKEKVIEVYDLGPIGENGENIRIKFPPFNQ